MENENLSTHDLEEMLDYAWQNSIKYRFDPVAGRIHQEYLEMIKSVKEKQSKITKK